MNLTTTIQGKEYKGVCPLPASEKPTLHRHIGVGRGSLTIKTSYTAREARIGGTAEELERIAHSLLCIASESRAAYQPKS